MELFINFMFMILNRPMTYVHRSYVLNIYHQVVTVVACNSMRVVINKEIALVELIERQKYP